VSTSIVHWYKKTPTSRELEAMLPPPPPNYVHVVIGGNLVMYNRATLQIGDVFRLDAAYLRAMGRTNNETSAQPTSKG